MAEALFENFVVAEIYKYFYNRGIKPPLYHFRDSQGVEVDIVIEDEGQHLLLEIKTTMSPKKIMLRNLSKPLFNKRRFHYQILLLNISQKPHSLGLA
jgi:predicted AAA+ superfamily ATPase